VKPPEKHTAPFPLRRRCKPVIAALLAASALAAVPPSALAVQGAPKAAAKDAKAAPAAKPAPKKDASVAFFREGRVPRLKIVIADAELNQLRQKNREYVRCTVTEEGGKQYTHVGIHLKGAAGSFRGVDDRPALTLNFDKFQKDQSFHDLDKIHLNNSVQDPGYLDELISSELFLAAGIPAARVTHARVWLNGRDLGFYVLKEGFDKDFLERNGLDPNGNLYEGAFLNDIDGQISLKSGNGPADRSDVKALIAACREPDPAKRWQRLEQLVDIDRVLTFVALERMTGHWDGYSQARNNYRFYFDPKSGKVQFFPHGMDQMFRDPNYGVLNPPAGMVGAAVMANPEWRGRYRDRLNDLMKLFTPAERLQKRVDEHHQRLRPVLAEMGAGPAGSFDGQVKQLKDRLAAREKSLLQQTAVAEPRPPKFAAGGVAALTRWDPRQETPDAKLGMADAPGGSAKVASFAITAGPSGRCIASWRTKVTLPAGKYRFEARARTEGVKALQDTSGAGAGIRVSGGGRTNKLDGTSNWTALTHEFQVQAASQDVELVAELRGTAGQAFFDKNSLRLVRVGP